MLESEKGTLFSKPCFNKSLSDFGDEQRALELLRDAFKIKRTLLGCLVILFLLNDGTAGRSLITEIEIPTI